MRTLACLFISALSLPALAAQVYDSPNDDGVSAGARPLSDDGSAVVLSLYIDGGPAESAPVDKCTGDGDGDELCAWDVSVEAVGGLEILNFQPEPGVVSRFDNASLRVNGMDAFNPVAQPQRIGAVTVSSLGEGDLVLSRGLAVYSDLAGTPLTPALLASTDVQLDTDGDGVADAADNCTLVSNADQRDTDNDGFGNICDSDLNNDNIVNASDLGAFRAVFFTSDEDADFNDDGIVNALDLSVLKQQFFGPPGPSGSL